MWHAEDKYMLLMVWQQTVLNDEAVVNTLNATHCVMHAKSILTDVVGVIHFEVVTLVSVRPPNQCTDEEDVVTRCNNVELVYMFLKHIRLDDFGQDGRRVSIP